MSAERVGKGTVVALEYQLHLGDGEVVDQSGKDSPLVYLHGAGQLVPGLEAALEGAAVGESKQVVVPPAQGYGEYEPELLQELPRDRLPPGTVAKEGEVLTARTPDGEVPFLVKEVRPDALLVDLNHPLAGEMLHFSVTVKAVRAATQDELDHGHVHGEGGAHD